MKHHAASAAPWLLILGVLGVTALVPASPHVIDLVTGAPVAGARLEPIRPLLRTLLEPVYGPIHLLNNLSDGGLLSSIAWLAAALFGWRLERRRRRGELRQKWWSEVTLLFGLYPLLALGPLPLLWTHVIPHDFRKFVTPIGLPLAVFVVVAAVALRRPSSRGRRARVLLDTTVRFIGLVALSALAVLLIAFGFPGMRATGRRLVAPPGKILADLHAHSQTSQDAVMNGPARLEFFQDHGIAIGAVTEHNCFDESDAPGDWNYTSLSKFVRERGLDMTLLPGEEFTTHALHVILLGIRRSYVPTDYRCDVANDEAKSTPPDFGYDYRRLIADVHRDGGFVVVAHWDSPRQFVRVDWKRLVEFGVDGFEIATDTTWAARDLIDQWRKAGMLLVAGSDYHGWRDSLYCWNLVDSEWAKRDPYEIVRHMFKDRSVEVVVAATNDARVPVWCEPPVDLWVYFTQLTVGARAVWAVFVAVIWIVASAINGAAAAAPRAAAPPPDSPRS